MKLEVSVRKSIPQVETNGRYVIKTVSDPRNTKFGSALLLTLVNTRGEERVAFVPYSSEPSDQSSLGKLISAFGFDTSLWPRKKIDIVIDADNRRRIKPVTK